MSETKPESDIPTPTNGDAVRTGGKMNKMEAVRRALDHLGPKASNTEIQTFVRDRFDVEMNTKHISSYKGDILKKRSMEASGEPREAAAAPVELAVPEEGGAASVEVAAPAPTPASAPAAAPAPTGKRPGRKPGSGKAKEAGTAAPASSGQKPLVSSANIRAIRSLVESLGVEQVRELITAFEK